MLLAEFKSKVERYAQGKMWYWYAPLWLLGAYAYVNLLGFNTNKPLAFVVLIPYSFDFMLHEWAHIFTAFLPAVLSAAAGSLSELLFSAVLVCWAFKERSYFASLFCLLWLEMACQSAGIYMADAVPQRLSLVSLGGALSGQEPRHDWNFVFGQLHLLPESAFIGNFIRLVGMAAGTFGICFSAWVLYKMSRAPEWANSQREELLLATRPETPRKKAGPLIDDGFTSMPLGLIESQDTTQTAEPSKHTGKQ